MNVAQFASDTDDALRQLGESWFKRLDEVEEEKTEIWAYRTELLRMAYAYARLIALSTGLKHAKEGQLDENTFIMRVGRSILLTSSWLDSFLPVLRSCL